MKEEFKLMNLKGTTDFLPEEQIIRNKITGKIYTEAEVTIVAVSKNGKLYRKMPEVLDKVFEQELKCLQPV